METKFQAFISKIGWFNVSNTSLKSTQIANNDMDFIKVHICSIDNTNIDMIEREGATLEVRCHCCLILIFF